MKQDTLLPQSKSSAEYSPSSKPEPSVAYLRIGTIILGYIGVYLCRKNFSVAVPLIQEHFHTTRAEVGAIASWSTIAYAVGKFIFGTAVDRIGGRTGFLASLFLVAVMGIAGGLATSLPMLAFFYSANRFAGAAAWPGMMKMTPSWFDSARLPFAIALLSLSFVAGGALASGFAGVIASVSHNNWRAIMAVPSCVLLALLLLNYIILPSQKRGTHTRTKKNNAQFSLANAAQLFKLPQFWIVCALSFSLTLVRETFNTWLVDMIRTEGGAAVSNQVAAFLSTPFDICGAVGILGVGAIYGKISKRTRSWLLFAMLALLSLILYSMPILFRAGLGAITVAIGLIGILVYGPYSLLGGTLSVEIRGQEWVGTVSGVVDGVGYLAGILAGAQFGRIVDQAGYAHGFALLAGLGIVSAILCLFLYRTQGSNNPN